MGILLHVSLLNAVWRVVVGRGRERSAPPLQGTSFDDENPGSDGGTSRTRFYVPFPKSTTTTTTTSTAGEGDKNGDGDYRIRRAKSPVSVEHGTGKMGREEKTE